MGRHPDASRQLPILPLMPASESATAAAASNCGLLDSFISAYEIKLDYPSGGRTLYALTRGEVETTESAR